MSHKNKPHIDKKIMLSEIYSKKNILINKKIMSHLTCTTDCGAITNEKFATNKC